MMIGDGLTLDQLQVFLTVAETGSFSAAARSMNRAQSAITYAVQKLEAQVGQTLFDRADYRPTLTEAGRALLPRARRIADEVGHFKLQAQGLAGGLEAQLPIVVDSMFPTGCFIEALRELHERFPSVQTRLYVESLGATAQMVLNGDATLGFAMQLGSESELLRRTPVATVELIHVAAADHPLAKIDRMLTADDLAEHVQLVLTDRSELTAGRDYGVFSTQTWRLADLGAKHALLKAGLGWGSLPRHMIEDDLASGRLVVLRAREWEGAVTVNTLPAQLIWRYDTVLGVAAQWMRDRVTEALPAH